MICIRDFFFFVLLPMKDVLKFILIIFFFASAPGKDADSETKLKRIEADLKILKLQVCCRMLTDHV